MMSLTFGLFTQVSGSGPLGPLVSVNIWTPWLLCKSFCANLDKSFFQSQHVFVNFWQKGRQKVSLGLHSLLRHSYPNICIRVNMVITCRNNIVVEW